jgi:predicted amidohydrolase
MDIQYAQSAVYSPSDHAFSSMGVVREAAAPTETMLMADVDLDLLKHLHERGSVQNLKDRRLDLYGLQWKALK